MTTLGLRFLQAVGEEPDLAAVWQPVRFDEESYAVTNAGEFWLTAMQHLARATGEDRWRDRERGIYGGANPTWQPPRGLCAGRALGFLRRLCRRLILFVENLDMVFEQMRSERDLHAMRSALIEHPEFLYSLDRPTPCSTGSASGPRHSTSSSSASASAELDPKPVAQCSKGRSGAKERRCPAGVLSDEAIQGRDHPHADRRQPAASGLGS